MVGQLDTQNSSELETWSVLTLLLIALPVFA